MNCRHCGKELFDSSVFCPYCGQPVNSQTPAPAPAAPVAPVAPVAYAQPPQQGGLSGAQKGIIVGLLVVVLALVGVLFATTLNKGNKVKEKKDPTRTIMIYLCGSDLESVNGVPSADLNAVDPSKIDLENTNVLVLAGGTSKWFNNFDPNETAIYKLEDKGWTKVESYNVQNMGAPKTLYDFITYSYENYPAGHYNLMFYDHGAALLGAMQDEISADILSLEEISAVMERSPFNEDNKLDSVIFRTCLNGTIEVASIFKDYADYITFSEEVTWGSKYTNVLGYFLDDLSPSADGYEVGKKFIDAYNKQMKVLDPTNSKIITYSIIDLSKIDKVLDELDEFIEGVDVDKNYSSISRFRSTTYQYGDEAVVFDTIDLKTMITELSNYSTKSAKNLLNAMNEAIVYNYSNVSTSNGLSIYFPYRGPREYQAEFLRLHSVYNFSRNYYTFIAKFNGLITGNSSFSFNYTQNETKSTATEVSIKLTDEQFKNYGSSVYAVMVKSKEHKGYYYMIYNSNDATLSDDGTLTTNISNNLLVTKPNSKGSTMYFDVRHRVNGGYESRTSNAVVYNKSLGFGDDGYMQAAVLRLTNDDNIKISGLEKITRDERVDGVVYNLNDYDYLEKYYTYYSILDKKGNLLNPEDWSKAPVMEGNGYDLDTIEFERKSVDDLDDELYVFFIIYDVNNEGQISKLIKVGE